MTTCCDSAQLRHNANTDLAIAALFAAGAVMTKTWHRYVFAGCAAIYVYTAVRYGAFAV